MKILFLAAAAVIPLTSHAQMASPMVMCPVGNSAYNVPNYVCSGLQAGFEKLGSAKNGYPPPTTDSLERCAMTMRQSLIEDPRNTFEGLCMKLWSRSYSDYYRSAR